MMRRGAGSLLSLALSLCMLATSGVHPTSTLLLSASTADFAPDNANCKGSFRLYREGSTIAGCYRFISTAMAWNNAMEYCQAQGGSLAAARTEGEQDFLLGLTSSTFWTSAKVRDA
jgi:hypothetical protein